MLVIVTGTIMCSEYVAKQIVWVVCSPRFTWSALSSVYDNDSDKKITFIFPAKWLTMIYVYKWMWLLYTGFCYNFHSITGHCLTVVGYWFYHSIKKHIQDFLIQLAFWYQSHWYSFSCFLVSGHFLPVTTNEFVYKSKFGTAKCSKGYICTYTVCTMRPFTLQPRLVLCSSWLKLGMVCWLTTWTRLELEVWHQCIAPNASSVAMLAGVGIAPWQSTRLVISLQSVMGLSPSRSCGRIFFSSQLSVLTLILVSVPPMLPQ